MIKIFLLLVMTTTPNWPSVKTFAEVYFTEEACEERRPIVENIVTESGIDYGNPVVWVETWCLETEMFYPAGT